MGELLVLLLELFGEFLLQIVFEVIADCLGHGIRKKQKKPVSPVIAIIGWTLLGVAAGGISLYFLPESVIRDTTLRLVNLFLTPLIIGCLMDLFGRYRRRHEKESVRMESFGYAFLFAFAMALVRYFWAV